MPLGQRRFIIAVILTLFIGALAMGSIIVVSMRNPGDAIWDADTVQSWSGTLIEQPYPMLIPDDHRSPAAFVVSMGKHGAQDRLEPFFDKHVTLSGTELNRDGRHLIELGDEPDAIVNDPSKPPMQIDAQFNPLKHATLTGEIVDGKCYLGAMKPGDGMGHRACAVLCIRSGLPPMFAANTPGGDPIYYLLLVDDSTNLGEDIMELVARPVTLSGEIGDLYGIPILQTNASNILRGD